MLKEAFRDALTSFLAALLIILTCMIALWVSYTFNMRADNALEEAAENVLEQTLGIEIDITPDD